jgi:hypothetical protein
MSRSINFFENAKGVPINPTAAGRPFPQFVNITRYESTTGAGRWLNASGDVLTKNGARSLYWDKKLDRHDTQTGAVKNQIIKGEWVILDHAEPAARLRHRSVLRPPPLGLLRAEPDRRRAAVQASTSHRRA